MEHTATFKSMPWVLAASAGGFLLSALAVIWSNSLVSFTGSMLVNGLMPVALAYLYFVVLADGRWLVTWPGFVAGAVGNVMQIPAAVLSAESAAPVSLANVLATAGAELAGVGYFLVGVGFLTSASKPNPPGILFMLGGIALGLDSLVGGMAVIKVIGNGSLFLTFAFGSAVTVKQILSGRQPPTVVI